MKNDSLTVTKKTSMDILESRGKPRHMTLKKKKKELAYI